jgi:hypothetical protein
VRTPPLTRPRAGANGAYGSIGGLDASTEGLLCVEQVVGHAGIAEVSPVIGKRNCIFLSGGYTDMYDCARPAELG